MYIAQYSPGNMNRILLKLLFIVQLFTPTTSVLALSPVYPPAGATREKVLSMNLIPIEKIQYEAARKEKWIFANGLSVTFKEGVVVYPENKNSSGKQNISALNKSKKVKATKINKKFNPTAIFAEIEKNAEDSGITGSTTDLQPQSLLVPNSNENFPKMPPGLVGAEIVEEDHSE